MGLSNDEKQLLSNGIVEIAMAFIKTKKIDCIFIEERNLGKEKKKNASIILTIIYNELLSLEENNNINQLVKEFRVKHNINVEFRDYDTYDLGLFDLYHNQVSPSYRYKANCRPYCLKNRLYDRTGKYQQLQDVYFNNCLGRKRKDKVVGVLPIGDIKKLLRTKSETPSRVA